MEQKLEFLKKYTMSKKKEVRIVYHDRINEIDLNLIPKEWSKIFEKKDVRQRIDMVLDIWKKHSSVNLGNTITYLTDNLENIELMQINDRYSALYTIKSQDGEIQYYEGRNPLESFNNNKLEGVWNKIPYSIREYYENVHNGFYNYASKAMGLVDLESVTHFDDEEWGVIENLKMPLKINLETTFGFFKSGVGGYIAIDYESCANNKATLWFTDDQPDYNNSFWDLTDEWIVIGFQSE